MILDSCSTNCGFIAAFVGCLGFGCFGVPMKGRAANAVNVDPYVMQSYKSFVYFATCWLVLLLGQEFTFTPWGLVSGLLWVPGGACGIYGIRNAGLAVSVGIWSAVTVLSSFAWGMLIFDEPVKSKTMTLMGVALMLVGLTGLSIYSSSSSASGESSIDIVDPPSLSDAWDHNSNDLTESLLPNSANDDPGGKDAQNIKDKEETTTTTSTTTSLTSTSLGIESGDCSDEISDRYSDEDDNNRQQRQFTTENDDGITSSNSVEIFGFNVSRRSLGIAGAAADGLLGGSCLVPMHYSEYEGLAYVISFAIGAAIVTILGWILLFLLNLRAVAAAITTTTATTPHSRSNIIRSAYNKLPSFHLDVLLIPGILAGTSWSIGNLGNILSVTYLGLGIGMSLVESSLIVSGLWGILWFREIVGRKNIVLWFCSAFVTLLSMFFLSREEGRSCVVGVDK